MAKLNQATEPVLTEPVVADSQVRHLPATLTGLVAIAAATAMIWLFVPTPQTAANLVPVTAADLADTVVTMIDPSNHAAVAAAVSMLRLPEPQRRRIEHEVAQRDRRIGWIVLTDSMDPDGDTVAIETAGIVQHVVLAKMWVPVAVPLDGNAPIVITAVRDGGGGGITVALATRRGPMALRIMLPGERIEVIP
jgi:hypothetical protein